MAGEIDDYELERLRAELAQEQQIKDMLQQSTSELQLTVNELEKRYGDLEEEGNEWKTRFETQEEMNQALSKQIILLHDQVDEARKNLQNSRGGKEVKDQYGDDIEATPHTVKVLGKDQASLEGQLRDLEWRLDQESKAYHKANEERKQYVTDINMAKYLLDDFKVKQRRAVQDHMTDGSLTPRANIPDDQRILDQRKGPINKMAAVKNLPKLNNSY